ncbi:hypothetical protein ANCCAN_07242 [Ancylostoma caninum]|uniref:Uncharacterized protein n=1 Tax=Ancylostoma caninum TaxID=29170 RepID=A0A368GQU2_ANCCA|nr:hypothetical protein ANCCAN_07242 [Ancylostoma caninum]
MKITWLLTIVLLIIPLVALARKRKTFPPNVIPDLSDPVLTDRRPPRFPKPSPHRKTRPIRPLHKNSLSS